MSEALLLSTSALPLEWRPWDSVNVPARTRPLAQKTLHQTLVHLAQVMIVQPHQPVHPLAIGVGKVHRLAAVEKGASLIHG